MNTKSIIQFVIFLALAVFMMWFATKDLNKDEVFSSIKASNKIYLSLIALIGVASIAFRAWRWQILIEPLGKRPGFINTFLSIFIGYGVNFFTPRLGEVARCGVLSKYEGIPADKLAGTMIAERIFDLICLLLLITITMLSEYTIVFGFFKKKMIELFGSNGLTIIGVVALLALVFGVLFLKKILRSDANTRIGKIVKNVSEGIVSVFNMKHRGLFLLNSLLIWVCYWSMTYFGFKGLTDTQHLTPGTGLSVLTFGSLGFLFPFNGAGAYQLIVQEVLHNLYNIAESPSKIYGILSWVIQNGILLFGAFAAMLVFPIYNRKNV